MPHVIIEYSADRGIEAKKLVITAHNAAIASGLFGANDIKTRAHAVSDYIVGEGVNGFVHVCVYLLEGRSTEQKKLLATSMSEALVPVAASGSQLTVDVRDMVKDTYRKILL